MRALRRLLQVIAVAGTLMIGIMAVALIVSQTPWFKDWLRRYIVRESKQYLNGEGSAVDLGCEMDKYGELKALLAGTTSIVGTTSPANRACYGTLARTVDQTPNGLGADKIQTAIIFQGTLNSWWTKICIAGLLLLFIVMQRLIEGSRRAN